ncbi:LysR family transcriptional regulator [Marilutibacter alkalisoli]|uniref:LysR family transcriptional regulator n=1 Tax=Marilutibacter alkalisoli TaxID=2591633 RepID=A0A514BPP2_9GAMM|nr:LysR family transcriptional regulator [Lysobacter alkalisoli]QDH69358.1 LysR family transcriptional regulator [Lysobacter alkalisoli]
MTLTQLRYLVAIADAGLNITLAAERVHATQPGLSKQLKQLEDELGFQLFMRRGRSLEAVAPAGERVIAHARRILEEAANIRAYAANERGEHVGRLVLATTHTQARHVLPGAIATIKRAWPRISVHLEPVADGEVLEQLAHGAADMAVLSTAGQVPDGGLAVPLFRWQRKVIVPKAHPLAGIGRAPTLVELSKYPLVSYESSIRPESSLRRAFAGEGVEPQLAMTARDADLIKTYVRTGMGVGLLAEMALGVHEETDLVILPAPAAIPECIAWAVLPRSRVSRDYALELIHAIAPQIDRRDIRLVLEGNAEADWPEPPSWIELTQTMTL